MYKVKELSESLEISRQTVYNYLKDYSNELKEHIVKKKGTTYIDDEGLNISKISTEDGLRELEIKV